MPAHPPSRFPAPFWCPHPAPRRPAQTGQQRCGKRSLLVWLHQQAGAAGRRSSRVCTACTTHALRPPSSPRMPPPPPPPRPSDVSTLVKAAEVERPTALSLMAVLAAVARSQAAARVQAERGPLGLLQAGGSVEAADGGARGADLHAWCHAALVISLPPTLLIFHISPLILHTPAKCTPQPTALQHPLPAGAGPLCLSSSSSAAVPPCLPRSREPLAVRARPTAQQPQRAKQQLVNCRRPCAGGRVQAHDGGCCGQSTALWAAPTCFSCGAWLAGLTASRGFYPPSARTRSTPPLHEHHAACHDPPLDACPALSTLWRGGSGEALHTQRGLARGGIVTRKEGSKEESRSGGGTRGKGKAAAINGWCCGLLLLRAGKGAARGEEGCKLLLLLLWECAPPPCGSVGVRSTLHTVCAWADGGGAAQCWLPPFVTRVGRFTRTQAPP